MSSQKMEIFLVKSLIFNKIFGKTLPLCDGNLGGWGAGGAQEGYGGGETYWAGGGGTGMGGGLEKQLMLECLISQRFDHNVRTFYKI